MDKKEAIKKVKEYTYLLKDHLDLEQVYLFGSFARDNYHEDSDIDVAIVVHGLSDDFFSINPLIWKLRRKIDSRIEPVLIEKDNDPGGFLDDIHKYAIEIPI